MKEELVSIETAALAKDKGFDEPVRDYYQQNDYSYGNSVTSNSLALPTQSLLQKWLREKHGINVFMAFKPNIKKWDYFPSQMKLNGKEYVKDYNTYYRESDKRSRNFDTYELALEAGLLEALKLI